MRITYSAFRYYLTDYRNLVEGCLFKWPKQKSEWSKEFASLGDEQPLDADRTP
jgi:hypothetical protein